MDYRNPDLVREAGEIAIKLPREQMTAIMVQTTEFLDALPRKGITIEKTQELSWPRKGVVLKNGTLISAVKI